MALEVQSVGVDTPYEWIGLGLWAWLGLGVLVAGVLAALACLGLRLSRLSKDQEKMQAIWRNMPDVVCEVDAAGIIKALNKPLSPKVSVEEIIGSSSYDYLDEQGQAQFRLNLNRALDTGHSSQYELEIALKGQITYLHNTIVPLKSGYEARAIVITSDITRFKDAQRILQQDKQQSERLLQSKAQFLTNVSQELHGPMSILKSTLKQLADAKSDQRHQHLYTMQASVEHMSQVVDDMAVLAQSEKGEISLESVNTSLWHILDDLEALYLPESEQQQIKLTFSQGSLPHYIMADAFRFRQVLYNLISGHLAICQGGELTMDIRQVMLAQEQVIQFTLTNSVAPDQLNNWVAFFNQGLAEAVLAGLDTSGLAAFKISQNLVGHLQGIMGAKKISDDVIQQWFTLPFQWVKQTDHFSLFIQQPVYLAINNDDALQWFKVYFESLQIPFNELKVGQALPQEMSLCVSDYCQPEQARWLWWLGNDYDLTASQGIILNTPYRRESLYYRLSDYQNAQQEVSVDTTPGRVLLVEDNLNNQLVIKRTLEKLGYQVVVANNGEEGVQQFKTQDVDCVIMDIQMPVMDGIEATRQIRKLNMPYVPVIALTANSQKEMEEACFAVGMDSFLTKPISRHAIQSTLEAFIGKQNPVESGATQSNSNTLSN
ncbi:MAG: response regulator [Gammaproteobacteria bacterium]|nr:response regulator [Gammaproteobacteria bacterium]